MIRISKLTDYGIVLLTHFAREGREKRVFTARDLAEEAKLPLPTVGKILKLLSKRHILQSLRGVKGGYQLTLPPSEIPMSAIIEALEGPIKMTSCSREHTNDTCDYPTGCSLAPHWQKINGAVVKALGNLTLLDMSRNSETPTIHVADKTPDHRGAVGASL